MPTYETKPTMREGNGPPAADLGTIGDRYTDTLTGEKYAKRKTGWTNAARVEIHPTIRQKASWVEASRRDGQNLEEWVCNTLDAAARSPLNPPLGERASIDPSTAAGTDVPADPDKV